MGNLINFLAIIIGSLVGYFIGHKFKEEMKNIIMECAGLFIIIAGVKSTINSNRDIIILVYLLVGSIIGQILNIDLRMKKIGLFLEKKFENFNNNRNLETAVDKNLEIEKDKKFKEIEEKEIENTEKSFAKGFSTATILFCTGAMAIVGSINSGLLGDNTTLTIKAILDGVIAIVMTSLYGIGVMFSAVSVFLYQGFFYLFANQLKPYLTEKTVSDINFLGGIMVMAIGVNLVFKKEIKIANMLPAIFIPIIVEVFV